MLIFFDFFRYDHFFDIGANIGLFSFYATKIKDGQLLHMRHTQEILNI